MFVPMTSDFNVFYFVTFYTLIYCIIYTCIYNLGFSQAKAQVQAEANADQSRLPAADEQPVPQAEDVQRNQAPNALYEEQDEQDQPDEVTEEDYTPTPYNHVLWPSPRPINFVRAIIEAEPEFRIYGRRLTHAKAVDILAQRAYMTRREFLRTNPLSYSERYMKGLNALYLLKDSIDTLEETLRNESYKQELRRIENGRCVCPHY
jgi:hypothetical protein